MTIAVLDIGSNSVKLLVVELDGSGRPQRAFDSAPITRLSEGLEASGRLREDAMARTIDTIGALLDEADLSAPERVSAIVTAPGRRAANGADFVERLQHRLGIRAEVASAEREAMLSQIATQHAFPELDSLLMIDLGGASTELVLCGAPEVRPISVDIGAVRLTEGWLSADPPSPHSLAIALEHARQRYARVAGPFLSVPAPAVFVSGTVTTLASLHLELPVYDPDRVHRTLLERDELEALYTRLAPLSLEAKRALPSINPKRADVIVGGLVLVLALFEVFGLGVCHISDHGTRWGLVWEQLAQ